MPSTTVWTRQSQPQHMQQQQQQRALHAPSAAVTQQSQQRTAAHLRLQKQNSFTEANRKQYTPSGNGHLLAARRAGSGYLTRGLSVDRSLENIRKKLQTHNSTAGAHEEQTSKRIITRKSTKSSGEKLKNTKTSTNTDDKHGYTRANSTSSMLKSLDHELKQVNGQLVQRFNYNSVCAPASFEEQSGLQNCSDKSNTLLPSSEQEDQIKNSSPTLKGNNSKVNLNIVLSHAINYIPTNGNESNNSDIESSSENAEPNRKSTPTTRILRTDLPARTHVSATVAATAATAATSTTITANDTVQQRRAQFRSSRNVTINTSISQPSSSQLSVPLSNNALSAINNQQQDAAAVTPLTSNSSGVALNVTPSLIVQRRPPLVRAMSAPVRSRSLDENSKGVFAFQKRKLRRRKLISRNVSVCEKSEPAASEVGAGVGGADGNDMLYDLNGFSGKKQQLTRTRSTLAVDVITLVSLVSSEGSDSEKEDSAPETGRGNAERSRSTGMPSLRKTGKSVSFQENYPPNFQLATKEYSHMIRRGSVAPLAARLRANRPPTAPPVSIFMKELNTNSAMTTNTSESVISRDNVGSDSNSNIVPDSTQNTTKHSTELTLNDKENEEYTYPEYVRSLKERECWKLYRKMSVKGVSVTYETVLRGMLTPTEFRQIQKQREIEEAKARALEEEKDAALEQPTPTSAVDRLTQKLLKK